MAKDANMASFIRYIVPAAIVILSLMYIGARVRNTNGVQNDRIGAKDITGLPEASIDKTREGLTDHLNSYVKPDSEGDRGSKHGDKADQPINFDHQHSDNQLINLDHTPPDMSGAGRNNSAVGSDPVIDQLEEQRRAWEEGNRASLLYGVDVESRLQKSTHGDLFHPLPHYQNPCWREVLEDPSPNSYFKEYCKFSQAAQDCTAINEIYKKRWRLGQRTRLRCLPYFFFVGVTKAGTTDLKYQLSKHPNISSPILSEINWWNRRRQGEKTRVYGTFGNVSFDEYVGAFDLAAETIDKTATDRDGGAWHPLVTYDGSSQMFWEHDGWESLPANENRDEPVVTYIDSLRYIRPNARIIIMARNPVERLFSHYCMLTSKNKNAGAVHFHNSTVYAIRRMNKCLASFSLRKCIYDTELADDLYRNGKIVLRAGLYAPFYMEWAQVFTPERVLVVRSEDYYKDRVTTLNSIGDFLGLGPMPVDGIEVETINEEKPKFQRRAKPEMMPETRRLLEKFYMPHNVQLARILRDKRFMWLDGS